MIGHSSQDGSVWWSPKNTQCSDCAGTSFQPQAIGLRVHNLDMLRRRASVSENAVQSGKHIYVGSPKAHKQRTVPLPESSCHIWPASARERPATAYCGRETRADT